MSTAQKILLFAVGALVLAFFVVIGITTATEGQKIANSGTAQAKEVSNEYSEIDRTVYDHTDVLGSTLTDLIDSVVEDNEELAIGVHTNANAANSFTYYHYTRDGKDITTNTTKLPPVEISNPNYINPNAQFQGKVYKDANNNIIAIEFTQHK